MQEIKNDNEFEKFLQTEADTHQLFPSDKIWRNINKELHGDRSWPALTIMSVLLISCLTFFTTIYNHTAKVSLTTALNTLSEPISKSNNKTSSPKHSFLENQLSNAFVGLSENKINATNSQITETQSSDTGNLTISSGLTETNSTNQNFNVDKNTSLNKETTTSNQLNFNNLSQLNTLFIQGIKIQKQQSSSTALTSDKDVSKTTSENLKDKLDKPKTDDFLNDLSFAPIPKKIAIRKKSRFSFNFYATPSLSYRRLVDDKTRDYLEPNSVANGPISPRFNLTVNDVVKHKPAMGLEIGTGFSYRLSKKLTINTGLQFNVRKYYIDSYVGGFSAANIAIVRNNRLDTISEFTTLNANTGFAETQLDNRLFQVSMPVGLQWNVFNYKKLGINIAGSLQPTLTLNKNVYLISTDYKYYADGTRFFRTWNVNSTAEVNVSYKVKNYNWYLGYQLRSQHLPTYNEAYPIREFRIDYGIKLGFSKQLFK